MTHAPHCVRYYWEGEWWHLADCETRRMNLSYAIRAAIDKGADPHKASQYASALLNTVLPMQGKPEWYP